MLIDGVSHVLSTCAHPINTSGLGTVVTEFQYGSSG